MTGAGADAATYVFAVGRSVDPAVLRGLPGVVPAAPVRPLRCGPLTAVVQHLPRQEAGEDAWQARLSDPTALERTARAHHAVVAAVARHTTTVPLALATLYLGDDRAREALVRDAERFAAVLRRIEGREEWGVKVYPAATAGPAGPDAAPPAPPTPPDPCAPQAARPGDGRAYLARRRAEHQARASRQHDAQRIADTVDEALRVLAAAARRLRPHTARLTGERTPQVLNAAYLVAKEHEAAFLRSVAALRRRTGARIDVSGPWVPYSFAALPGAPSDEAAPDTCGSPA